MPSAGSSPQGRTPCISRPSDIRGAKPKTFIKANRSKRETNDISDIEGSRPKKEYLRTKILNPLAVKDINEFRIFRTSRVTNPLDPEYTVPGEEKNTQIKIGKVQGSSSKILHPQAKNRIVSYSLKNDDILGSRTGTTGNKYVKEKNRKHFGKVNQTKDIPGAQTSTLRKGIQTKRCLNPLVPAYKYPGHEQDKEYLRSLYDPHYKPPADLPAAHQEQKVGHKNESSLNARQAFSRRAALHRDGQKDGGKEILESKVINQVGDAGAVEEKKESIPLPDYKFESMVPAQPDYDPKTVKKADQATESKVEAAHQPSAEKKAQGDAIDNLAESVGVVAADNKSKADVANEALIPAGGENTGGEAAKELKNDQEQESKKPSSKKGSKKKEFLVGNKKGRRKLPLHKRINREQFEKDKFEFYGVRKENLSNTEVQQQINTHLKTIKKLDNQQKAASIRTAQPKLTKLQKFDQFMQSDAASKPETFEEY